MPWPDPDPAGSDAAPLPGANTDLGRLVAAAADLCRKPLRHGVLLPEAWDGRDLDLRLRIEARDPEGRRLPEHDLELELYPSGPDLHLTLAWAADDGRPMLWQGGHPVWMDGGNGQRCAAPADGAPLEALARRLRALLVG
ncbi:MAG: hypothetical protein VKO65_00430 [Cyanobacteriota bacterium]|nr:hypothetical protein [Cyanobacteriota bacterium]